MLICNNRIVCVLLCPLLSFSLLCLGVINVVAEEAKPIYKTIDENGRTVFTDNPPVNEETEAINLKETNIQPGGQQYSEPLIQKLPQQDNVTVKMQSPVDGARYGPTQKSVTFVVDVSRPLNVREGIVFYMDGEALNSPSSANSHTVALGIKVRGMHVVTAALVNTRSNQMITQSSPVRFYVIRPTH